MKKPGKITDIKPIGSQVLVELLSAQEAIGTLITIGGSSTDTGAPQGYVIATGQNLDAKSWGFKIGDRVLLQGKHVPLPSIPAWKRDRSLVEPSMIKAVIEETDGLTEECCGGGSCESKIEVA